MKRAILVVHAVKTSLRGVEGNDVASFQLQHYGRARAVAEVAHTARHLIDSLVTTAEPRDREVEAEKARARSALRLARP